MDLHLLYNLIFLISNLISMLVISDRLKYTVKNILSVYMCMLCTKAVCYRAMS